MSLDLRMTGGHDQEHAVECFIFDHKSCAAVTPTFVHDPDNPVGVVVFRCYDHNKSVVADVIDQAQAGTE